MMQSIYTTAVTLILIMDPLGNIPVFLSILKKYDHRKQVRIILRETLIAFCILLMFLFFGHYIMSGLQLTTEALSIAGGIILFMVAIQMIFPRQRNPGSEEEMDEPFIVPLAVPLTAGPAAIAMVMLLTTQALPHTADILCAIIIATAFFLLVMLTSPYLMKLLGRRCLIAIERLMGMILTTVAVQMFLSGVVAYIKHN